MEGIVRIDCAGLSPEAVVAEAWRLVGEADGVEQVLLERVGAAGPLARSTGEPARVRQWARYHAREAFGGPEPFGESISARGGPRRPDRRKLFRLGGGRANRRPVVLHDRGQVVGSVG